MCQFSIERGDDGRMADAAIIGWAKASIGYAQKESIPLLSNADLN
jgi:hypothetical protein